MCTSRTSIKDAWIACECTNEDTKEELHREKEKKKKRDGKGMDVGKEGGRGGKEGGLNNTSSVPTPSRCPREGKRFKRLWHTLGVIVILEHTRLHRVAAHGGAGVS